MLNIRKLSSEWNKDWLNASLSDTRSTVFRGVGKRPYLGDCMPLTSVFTIKNLTLQTAKAALIPANLVIAEYNKHVMECEQREEDIDFDWKSCLERNFVKFQYEAQRMMSVSIIKKFLEEFSINICTPKIADKLTKNIGKSLTRKCSKFGHKLASQKIFFTALWGNIFTYSSLCVYDVSYKIGESIIHFYSTWRKKGLDSALRCVNVKELCKFIGKKLVFFSACWFSSSGGFSVGSLCNEKYGGVLGSLIFELVTATAVGTVLVI